MSWGYLLVKIPENIRISPEKVLRSFLFTSNWLIECLEKQNLSDDDLFSLGQLKSELPRLGEAFRGEI